MSLAHTAQIISAGIEMDWYRQTPIATPITRSFSKTKQVASFEPINSFCSVQAEYDEPLTDEFVKSISEHLDKLVRQEVERTIENEMKKVEAVKKNNTF
jgi:hypothetical protein